MTEPAPAALYDADEAVLQRRAFADASVYHRELATMFDRSWLFVAPAGWVALTGDFATSLMGDQPVIAWRNAYDQVQVFINKCPASDQLITSSTRGHAAVLHCPCHNWAFSPDGKVDVGPLLEPIKHVAHYRGLLFANRDANSRPFKDWLGDFAWYLDMFLPAGGVSVYGNDALRWLIDANWKLPMLSGCGDLLDQPEKDLAKVARDGAQIQLGGGAVAVCRADHGNGDDPRDGFQPLAAVLFPNLILDPARRSLDIVHPIAPTRCAIHSYCLVEAASSVVECEEARRLFQFFSGPAGVKQGHQALQWQAVTAGAVAGRHRDQALSLRLGLGQETLSNLPGSFSPLVSEANQRGFFNWWQRQLIAPIQHKPRLMRLW